jgi:hypothetical protein
MEKCINLKKLESHADGQNKIYKQNKLIYFYI